MEIDTANERVILGAGGANVGIGTTAPAARLDVKGNLSASLSGTFTATNGSATLSSGSSTAFTTQLVQGSAIEIFEGTTSRGVFTVSSITSASQLELDSTVSGLSSSSVAGMTAKTDSSLFSVQTGDGQTAFKMPKPGQLEVLQTSSLKQTNLLIGDETTGEDLTTGIKNIFIGCAAGKENTLNGGTICIGHDAGSYGISEDGGVYIGFENRGASGGKTVAVGRDAGSEQGGQLSVCVGWRAGRVSNAGYSAYFGQYSTMIGANTRPASNNDENSIAVGFDVTGHGPNTAVIGNANITSLATGGDGVCSLGTDSNGFKDLNLKTAFNSASSATFGTKGIDVRKADDSRSFEVLGGGGVRSTFDDTNGLTQSSADLIMICHTGDCNEHQLTANITSMTIHFYPPIGTFQTRTCIFQQRDTSGGSAYTITYPATAAAYTGYGVNGLGNVPIKWAGGVKHTMSSGDQAFDIVQFILTHDTSGNEMIYASVIGQAYA